MIFNFALRVMCLLIYLNQKVSTKPWGLPVVPFTIVGGIDSDIEDMPWQVQLREKSSLDAFCGGSIISQNWIVSAAHCTIDEDISSFVVVVGTNSLSAEHNGTTYQISKIINHESYDRKKLLNDISLLKISTSISFSDKVKAVPMSSLFIGGGKEVLVSGYGYTNRRSLHLPTLLQKLKTNTLENDDCIPKHPKGNKIALTNLKICTLIENKPQGFCNGDSGGPLTLDGKLIGVVSWGTNGCAEGIPDVYERIAPHCDWIKQKSGISCQPNSETTNIKDDLL